MDIFDQYAETIEQQLKCETIQRLLNEKSSWPVAEKNPFLMERDTALELGGYPKESLNLTLSSTNFDFGNQSGVYLIGDPELRKGKNNHLSFGKIVLIKNKDVEKDDIYNYLKSVEFADIRQHFSDIMVRMSSQKLFTNLRIGKKAMKKGFTIEKLGWAMYRCFLAQPQIEQVKIIMIVGDSPLYKKLLPVAEKIKDATSALNTMFDGMDLDCQSCKLSEICDEVEGLKKMHQQARTAE
ncbi:hypothetical protein [Acetobacterium malicum]|uniref:hypothetical protein n=1 Tax=Acetobacterium malicum TaxID=52692 RepID=UPI000425467F|nr:hypothetical protein [Acetobacterium dehalogenans]